MLKKLVKYLNSLMATSISYTLLLRFAPTAVDSSRIGLKFCEELVSSKQNSIRCLFLQNEAAYFGLDSYKILQDEANVQLSWQGFVRKNQIPAFICSNSALRRGVFDSHFAALYNTKSNLAEMFQLASLGTLFEAIANTDRFIQL